MDVKLDDTFLLILTSEEYTGSTDRGELACRVGECKRFVVLVNDEGPLCNYHAGMICFEPGCTCVSTDADCMCSDHIHDLKNPFES